jgi:23S rRNA pseudouridine1911/1915/1917 synthase
VATSAATHHRLEVGEPGKRLDQFLADALADGEPPLTRSQLRRLIDDGRVAVNGVAVTKAGAKLRLGDVVEVAVPPPAPAIAIAQDIALAILFEDAHLVVVDKPAGLVVHPSPGHPDGTLVNALLHHAGDLGGIGGTLRPGIVHRLDKDTSGVMVVAKHDAAHLALAALFKDKVNILREYLAVVAPPPALASVVYRTLHGRHPVDRKRFSSKVERGKPAVTHVRVEERFAGAALVRCRLETGRTHQIRVHLADHGHPIVGDPLYGRRPPDARVAALGAALGRQALHAAVLGFAHPITGAALRFETPAPADVQALLAGLRGVG